jgi:hypothetical protein
VTLRAVARDPGGVPFPPIFAALALGCAAAAWVLLALPERQMQILPVCPFKAVTGLPCPTCGGTHALAALAGARPLAALRLNPLVTLAALVTVAAGAASLFRRWRGKLALRLDLTPIEQGAARAILLGLLALHWAYLLWQR